MPVACTSCRLPYPAESVPHRCPRCLGVFDFTEVLPYDPRHADPTLPGIWRHRASFDLPPAAPTLSLGEGDTPLVWSEVSSQPVAFKCEHLQPTGSFKDRGSAALLSFVLSRHLNRVVEDSSGNAGASLAAYASRAGLSAQVFIPDSASGPKRDQIEAYGAQLVRILGPRSNASQAVLRFLETAPAGTVYASHAHLPFNLPGYATLAFELVEQLGRPPGSVLLPVGQGGLLLGLWRGFTAMRLAGAIPALPVLVGVQARACAPLWALSQYGADGMSWVAEAPTLAEGIRIIHPVRGDAVLHAVAESGGFFLSVEEEQIPVGRTSLAGLGFFVEPTSAVVWDALHQAASRLPAPLVTVLTGSGFKAPL